MIDDQARALLIVGALLTGASGSAGFVGGRMTAPATPFEVRFVHIPVPAISLAPAEAAPIEPAPAPQAPAPPAVTAEREPAAGAPPPEVEARPPLPQSRPKIEAKPKEQRKPQPKPEREAPKKSRPPAPAKKPLPSCAVVKREYEAMTYLQRMAAYHRATPEEIAHGKRCLGF